MSCGIIPGKKVLLLNFVAGQSLITMKKRGALGVLTLMALISGAAMIRNNAAFGEKPVPAGEKEQLIQDVGAAVYKIGDAVADFALRNVNGKTVSLASYPSAKGFLIVFTCNHCPFSRAYEDRLEELNHEFSFKGYPLIAINPNDPEAYEEDSFVNMQKRAEEKNYSFAYLSDEKQTTAKAFGAQRTPQAFVLKREGDKHILSYSGAIDDNAQDKAGVIRHYVRDALESIIGNKPVMIPATRPVGCAVKWKN